MLDHLLTDWIVFRLDMSELRPGPEVSDISLTRAVCGVGHAGLYDACVLRAPGLEGVEDVIDFQRIGCMGLVMVWVRAWGIA